MVCESNPKLLITMVAITINICIFVVFFVFYIHYEDVLTVFINSIVNINLVFLWIFLDLLDVKALHNEEQMSSTLFESRLDVIKCDRCRTIHCEYILFILAGLSVIAFCVNTIIGFINGVDNKYIVWDILFFIFTTLVGIVVLRKAFLKNREYNQYVITGGEI